MAVGVINDGATVIRLGRFELFGVGEIRDLAVGVVHVEQRGGVKSGTAEDPASRVWIPEVKATGHLAGRVVAVTVELKTIVEQMAEVCEQLEVVVVSRRPPNLRRVAQIRIACVDDVQGVLALDGTVSRCGGAVLHAEVSETVRSKREPDVAGYGKRSAVSADSVTRVLDVADDARPARRRVPRIGIEEAPGLDFQAASRGIVLQLEVHDSGNGVRAVLRRRAVAQHLDLPNGNRRNDGDVRPLRAVGDAISQPSDDRRAVAALSVDQDQRMVGRQVAQVNRTDDGPRIADRLSVDVEGGDDSPQLAYQVPTPLASEVLGTDDVHGHGGLDR